MLRLIWLKRFMLLFFLDMCALLYSNNEIYAGLIDLSVC